MAVKANSIEKGVGLIRSTFQIGIEFCFMESKGRSNNQNLFSE